MLVFGPVPSRRLGRSLGINNILPKHCSYSCLYCQVGPTKATEMGPRHFYKPENIYQAVSQHLDKLKATNETVDYLTFVPDGEPTLDAGLGNSIELLRGLNIKIAVISNASLIWQPEVREILKMADWVSLKVDSVDASVWRTINRPCEGLELDDILSGMLAFAKEFNGTLATETMLLEGINTEHDAVVQLGAFLQTLAPDKIYLAIPIRPMAENNIRAPDAATVNRVYQTLNQNMPGIELLTGYEGDAFASTGNFTDDLLSITAVHPMRKDAVLALLDITGDNWGSVQLLQDQGKLREIEYEDHYFYLRIGY
ncbi:MAG: radical SAM protein [Methylomicrobium sp.]|jgi:wyosine [tRNA(Phe)-imidazoG37] synthetase (radical SAM superfamily)|nr:radical SAM protein [Methylomicrobium sp.]